MTSEDKHGESEHDRIRRIEQELMPDAIMHEVIDRDAAYLTGKADGAAGRITEWLALDPERGTVYRRGLQEGRTEKVDAELIERFTAELTSGEGGWVPATEAQDFQRWGQEIHDRPDRDDTR